MGPEQHQGRKRAISVQHNEEDGNIICDSWLGGMVARNCIGRQASWLL
jgi:hypothetical protein